MKCYPVGYAVNGSVSYVEALMSMPDMLLIDTRYNPQSWRHEWRKDALKAKYGTRYRWAGKFLGNIHYSNGLPIQIADAAVGIPGLVRYANEGHDLILLCQCPSFDSCHNKAVVELLRFAMPEVEVVLQSDALKAEQAAHIQTVAEGLIRLRLAKPPGGYPPSQ